jgi:TRAP-type C4-dicarboxylate transport system substrate-binding protein
MFRRPAVEMTDFNPSTKREALLAEVLGDVHVVLKKIDLMTHNVATLDKTMALSTAALAAASDDHRKTVSETVEVLRREVAKMLIDATTQAANQLVTQQSKVLEKAAVETIRGPVFAQWRKQNKQIALIIVASTSLITAMLTTALIKILGV